MQVKPFMGNKGSHEDEYEVLMILQNALRNTNEAFVTIDADHKVVFFNKAAEKMFGYGKEEVIGQDLDLIMSAGCSRNHREAVANYVKTRIPKRIGHETGMLVSRKNGDTFPASISFSVTELHGRLFFTGIVRDLSETEALREQITRSERLAALGQMVAEINHEIKNPLMMIGGFATQLIRTTDDEKNLQKLKIIIEEVKRLEKLLADLRELYAPKTITIEAVNLEELLREVSALVKADCEKKGIRITVNIDKSALLAASDKGRLEQVFLNLVKNSMEAMDEGGDILIQASMHGDRVKITVTDEGCGILEQDREKIFSPFFTTKKDGTGLGLGISKRIIEDHAGSSFTVKSQEGKGTTVTMTLPRYQEGNEDFKKTPERRDRKPS